MKKNWKWALIEVLGAKQNLLATGNKKLVKARFKDEKKKADGRGARLLLLMKLEKMWPKEAKAKKAA